MKVFQDTVARFVEAHRLAISVQARLLDLISEVGELAKEVLKATHYGHEPFQPTQDWADELGDLFFSLICIANSTGVNLEEALQSVLQKYESRFARKGDAGSE
jgi:NTP pyrophosphatase (non-canonical NTP hydrolase)